MQTRICGSSWLFCMLTIFTEYTAWAALPWWKMSFWHSEISVDEKYPSDIPKSVLLKNVLEVRNQGWWNMSLWRSEINVVEKMSFWWSEIRVDLKCPSGCQKSASLKKYPLSFGGQKSALLKNVQIKMLIRTDMQMKY